MNRFNQAFRAVSTHLPLWLGLGIAALHNASIAQTTVSGALDMYLGQTWIPGHSRTHLDSSGLSVSRLIIKSQEKLDANTTASVHLESTINVANGEGGAPHGIFDRMSYVSLQHDTVKLSLGKQFSPHLLQLGGEFDIFGTSFWGTPYAIFQAAGRYTLIPGALGVQIGLLPKQSLNLHFMVADRTDQATFRPPGRQYFLSGMYQLTPEWQLGASLVRDHHYSYANPDLDLKLLGFVYEKEAWRFSGGVQRLYFQQTGEHSIEYCLGAAYWLDSRNQVQLSYGQSRTREDSQRQARVLGVALTHHLSKQTALYASVAKIQNGMHSSAYFDEAVPLGAQTSNVIFGIRQKF